MGKIKTVFKAILCIVLVMLIIVASYVVYVLVDYDRIDDNIVLDVNNINSDTVETGKQLKAVSYNIGFCAYTPDFSFFMDGGSESRAKSEQSVIDVSNGITQLLKEQNADIVFMEEVDEDSDRSHHINEHKIITDGLSDYNSVYAINYDSPYLFYPLTSPHGKSLSGLLTLSKYELYSGLRRSLPIEDSLMKLLDLDRCYSVCRVKTDNSKELVVYTTHLSAYTSDGKVTVEQISMMIDDMKSEYQKGNYVICGGDFNKNLLYDSGDVFGVSGEEYNWAQPFPDDLLDDTGLSLVKPFDNSNPVASCRNADKPLCDDIYKVTVDGFIVSDNIQVDSADVIDTEFEYSDHNPVYMNFRLTK